ncbi:MAG TPA: T9SS type A sorting domain-containing protein [Chitinivibrionales bacterium]|nr:T9SS type A sorting domain-containing protein [Chitinivibrionales bacterium]
MPKLLGIAAVLATVSAVVGQIAAPDISLGFYQKTYAADDEVWLSVAVENAASLPGAYKLGIRFDTAALAFSHTVPVQTGPFAVMPSLHAAGDTIVLAGFQGVATGAGSANAVVLAVLSFKPRANQTAVDSNSFSWLASSVYGTDAHIMALSQRISTRAVMLPGRNTGRVFPVAGILLVNRYLVFSTGAAGPARVELYTVSGKKAAVLLSGEALGPGTHAVPIDYRLASGIYIARVQVPAATITQKVRVSR